MDALLAADRNGEALKQLALIPEPIRKQLDADFDFVQSEASLYAAVGDIPHAMDYMSRVEAHYRQLKTQPPSSVEIQNAWLLYEIGNDRQLYPALMRIGGRRDLTVAQRETVQKIWADWSVRRAGMAMDNGNTQRAVDILDAASQAFPDNLDVRKAVAGGYAMVGRAKESLRLYKTIPMQTATAGDFEGAVNAALAANDKAQAEIWLRQALERFTREPAILSLAARYEQARGDYQRAADFYRAALAAMPANSPTSTLAHELYYPEQDIHAHRAVTAADLQRLLDPDNEPFQKTTKLPPLPAYGPDPYSGAAPVPSPTQSDAAAPDAHLSRQAAHARYFGNASLLRVSSSPAPFASSEGEPPQDQAHIQQSLVEANPPHSMASDAYKGLVFSLMASGRNADALNEIATIPPAVRSQLEADIEFVQGEASLYASIGDTLHANQYLNLVESYYLLHRANMPAGLEVQHAWLLYSTQNDHELYPLLLRLDLRSDLNAAQRAEIASLWANFAVRRAFMAFDNGNLARGVMILQAASEQFPDNMNVRKAVAGAYAKVGKAQEAVALFKAIPMDNASSGDMRAAISAALAAPDLAQAEAWLRQAMARFPNDPLILGMAARFEKARGNNQRAADYWRAALAAMPPGSAAGKLDSSLGLAPGGLKAPAPRDLKRLLDPRSDPLQKSGTLPPLPSYLDLQSQPPTAQQQNFSVPDDNPLPLPPPSALGRAPTPLSSPRDPSQGSAAQIHIIANAQVNSSGQLNSNSAPAAQYTDAQYTPSAQDAAAGAYSAPKQLGAQPQMQPTAAPPAQPKPAASKRQPAPKKAVAKRAARKKAATKRAANATPSEPLPLPSTETLGQAQPAQPAEQQGQTLSSAPQEPAQPTPAPDASQASQVSDTGISDEELEQRNLPPLRGPWIRLQRGPKPIDPRAEAEMQLRSIESGYSSWLGGTGIVNYRSGALGFDHLSALEAPFEASAPLGYNARVTLIAKPVFLDSGQADGNSLLMVQEYISGKATLVSIPQPLGTLVNTNIAPPAQQNAVGIGGELQIAFAHLALAGGYTPYGFLVATFTGRAQCKPGNGPFTFNFSRDSVKDTQLSYAGLRDPGSASATFQALIWGGVMANQGNVQFAHGDARVGLLLRRRRPIHYRLQRPDQHPLSTAPAAPTGV